MISRLLNSAYTSLYVTHCVLPFVLSTINQYVLEVSLNKANFKLIFLFIIDSRRLIDVYGILIIKIIK